MLGSYSIVIDGAETGVLNVTKEGLMTVFEASCEDPGEILRLSVYGECEGYLGVMVPGSDGKLRLRKRLSRTALADFPKTIRYVSISGGLPESETECHDADRELTEQTEETPDAVFNRPDVTANLQENTDPSELAKPEMPNNEVVWRRGAGGALVGLQGSKRLLAVPLKSGVAPVGGGFQKQNINGTDYAVFDIKNGKII